MTLTHSQRQEIVRGYEQKFYDRIRKEGASYEPRVKGWLVEQYERRFGSTPEQDGLRVWSGHPHWGEDRIDVFFDTSQSNYGPLPYEDGHPAVLISFYLPNFENYGEGVDPSGIQYELDKIIPRIRKTHPGLEASELREAAQYVEMGNWYEIEAETTWEGWDPEEDFKEGVWDDIAAIRKVEAA